MFFAIDLLIPQHGGRFSIAWIAATRGIKYVDKKEIVQCNIFKLCDEILQMVQSSSTRPRMRLSLSLASRLVNGVAKVYKRQVEISIEDFQNFCSQRRGPILEISLSQPETATPPVPKIRRKRKRNVVAKLSDEPAGAAIIPEMAVLECIEPLVIDLEELARPSINQVHPDLITLREELPSRPVEEVFDEDFGGVGAEPPEFPPDVLEVAVPQPLQSKIAPSTPTKRKSTTVMGTPSKRRLFPQLEAVHESEIVEVLPEQELQVIPVIPQIIAELVEVNEVEKVPSQISVAPQPEDQLEGIIPPRGRGAPRWATKANINIRETRGAVINKIKPNAIRRYDYDQVEQDIPVILVEPLLRNLDGNQNDCRYLALILGEEQSPEEVEQLQKELLDSRKTNSLLRPTSTSSMPSLRRPVSSATPPTNILAEQLAPTAIEPRVTRPPKSSGIIPIVEEAPGIQEVIEPEIVTVISERLQVPDKTVQPLAESTGVTLPQLDEEMFLAPPERTYETEIAPVATTAQVKRAEVQRTSAEKKKILSRDRQKRIRDLVKNWNKDLQGDLTIEDVCDKPVNRMTIAVAFNDLLCLVKMGYVVLKYDNPDSLQLGTIEKAP